MSEPCNLLESIEDNFSAARATLSLVNNLFYRTKTSLSIYFPNITI